jgi:negative regulator of flagellin synthesis FlgM
MPPIELGPLRPIAAVDVRIARGSGGRTGAVAQAGNTPASPVAMSDALDPGQAPVGSDRVAQIRKAVESGTYPLIPATIADAVIAAGILLRSGK